MEPSPALSPPGTRTLLQEMYQHWPPQLLGGTAACLLLTLYPPVMVAFAGEWQRTGQPLDPCSRLIPRWNTAVTGTPDEIERLRRAAASAHGRAHGPMPAEVGAARFGTEYKATDTEVMTSMYVIVLYLMPAAQEFLGHRLADDGHRDLYCQFAAGTAGYAFGVQDAVPVTIAGLRRSYEAIVADRLQVTDLGDRTRQAMLAGRIGGIPGTELAALLLPRRVTGCLGPLAAPGDTLDRLRAAEPAPATRAGHGPARRRAGRAALTPARR